MTELLTQQQHVRRQINQLIFLAIRIDKQGAIRFIMRTRVNSNKFST